VAAAQAAKVEKPSSSSNFVGSSRVLSAVLTLIPLALAATGLYLIVFHIGTKGVPLLWLSGVSLLLIAVLIGGTVGVIAGSVFGAGFWFVILFVAGPSFLQSAVLTHRGVTVTATLTQTVQNPPFPASTDFGCRYGCSTHGYIFKTADGKTVRGYPYGNRYLQIGDKKSVVIDPYGQVDSRSPQQVQPVLYGFFMLLGALIALGVGRVSAIDWRARRLAHK